MPTSNIILSVACFETDLGPTLRGTPTQNGTGIARLDGLAGRIRHFVACGSGKAQGIAVKRQAHCVEDRGLTHPRLAGDDEEACAGRWADVRLSLSSTFFRLLGMMR
jgi:hypothetical protein